MPRINKNKEVWIKNVVGKLLRVGQIIRIEEDGPRLKVISSNDDGALVQEVNTKRQYRISSHSEVEILQRTKRNDTRKDGDRR